LSPRALAASRRSLDSAGLLLGVALGVGKIPLLIQALMHVMQVIFLVVWTTPANRH
jgi:hypothetical protein